MSNVAEDLRVAPALRYIISAEAGAPVTISADPASTVIHRLPTGAVVVCAQTHSVGGVERVRIASPAGWIDASILAPAEKASRDTMDFATFEQRHEEIVPGEQYGIAFPISLDGLREAGPQFLTAAFRASGAIAPDNRVTQIVSLDNLGIPGASENGLLKVAYERDEPGLRTELFVKFPAGDLHHKFGLLRLFDGEIKMMRLSRERQLPITTVAYYFGDYSAHTGNFMLITDRVPFGVDPVEPAYRKGYDHLVPSIDEHYDVLVRALAVLPAAQKRGDLGYDIEAIFPYGRAARDFSEIVDPEPRLDRLIDFIGRVAPRLFLPEVTTPEFLARWREDVLFGLEHKDAVIAYLLSDPDYAGLCHINLNVDNAWFWRDADGTLHAGLLDWGGAGQASLAQALSGMFMMPDPDHHLGLVDRMTDLFITELAANGGPMLDRAELRLQYKAAIYSTAIFLFINALADAVQMFPEEFFSAMDNRMDQQLLDTGFYTAIIWIDNMLREWLEELTPGDACRQIIAGRKVTPAQR